MVSRADVKAWMRVGQYVVDRAGLPGVIVGTDLDDDGIVGLTVAFSDGSREVFYYEPFSGPMEVEPSGSCPHPHEMSPIGTGLYRCYECNDARGVCDSCGLLDDEFATDSVGPRHMCYECLSAED